MKQFWFASIFTLALTPMVGLANSGANAAAPAPPLRRTGAEVDGGLSCVACHATNPVNSGSGSLVVRAGAYTPGIRQTIEIVLTDPDAMRWGFQLSARLASDMTKQAGVFGENADVQVRCDDGAVRGAPTPCSAGQLQFASHTNAGTRMGTTGSRTFMVQWTPPAADLGPVMLLVAGNAANGNGNNQGDRIYTTTMRVASAGCNLTGTPTVGGVSSAATGGVTAVNPNGLISIFGSGFLAGANTASPTVNDLSEGRWPTSLACIGVEVGGRRAPVFFAQGNQINAQVPLVADGSMPLRVILNPGTSNEIRSAERNVTVARTAPAFLTFDGTSIAALTSDFRILADPAVVPGGVMARGGDTVILYGVGFGFTNPVWQPGEFSEGLAPLAGPYTVSVGGTQLAAANIVYAGLASSAPGLYQFNIKLPDNLTAGNVPVSITVGGVTTQAGTTIPVR